ncbi:membrane protein [Pyrococcus abyssi virus 1]|uniref:membrane protein n=1 Tax=Pyrococcus abyssi virus 1 TaxID=425386 RepID=UPI00015529B2|nr:membrane protein [Pyrococcus abyssi virus 1]ABN58489.1 membrane protein [Pyrococcus abyssi virus 1]
MQYLIIFVAIVEFAMLLELLVYLGKGVMAVDRLNITNFGYIASLSFFLWGLA